MSEHSIKGTQQLPELASTRQRLAWRMLGVQGNIVEVRFREGKWLRIRIPDHARWTLCKELILLRSYESRSIRLSDCGGTVVDAGAHVGIFTLMAAQYAERVIALEPHPQTCDILRYNVRSNQAQNISVRNEALWSRAGDEPFLAMPGNSLMAAIDERGKLLAPTTTLEALTAEVGTIDLLKIDIEGAEFEVLNAADGPTLGRINAIVGEIHYTQKQDARRRALENRLRQAGFSIHVTADPKYHPGRVRDLLHNWNNLAGHHLMKLTLLLYLLVPLPKPLLPGLTPYTPHFYAYRTRQHRS